MNLFKRLLTKKEDPKMRYVIRVTTYIGADRMPRYSRVCDEEGQTMLYSKGSAEDTAREMADIAKEAGVEAKYDVIPDPNARED